MSSLTSEILTAYRHPRLSFERQLAKNIGDDRILFFGMLACFLAFVARMPSLFRDSIPSGSPPLHAVVPIHFAVSLLMAPLLLYSVAAASHVLARAFGGWGNWRDARLALFWAVLAMSPLVLVAGIVEVAFQPWVSGALLVLIAVLFFSYWMHCLIRVEFIERSAYMVDGQEAPGPRTGSDRGRSTYVRQASFGKPDG
ncbi:MAG: YIP1 family protein [Rhodobacteraceae bacterium]|nr:YIP1 family protein [Paracoccaceae bacterium]